MSPRVLPAARPFTLLTTLVLGCASLQACQRKEKAPAPVASASSIANTRSPRLDDDLSSGLKTISSACKIDPAAGSVSCAQGEDRKLTTMFASGKRERPAAIATLAVALVDANPALQTAAANLLNTAFRAPWHDVSVGAVDAADARALLQAALNAPKPLARQAVPAAVNAGFLAGIGDEVFAALDKADPAELRPLGYRYVMTHGRMAAFGKVQELAKDPSPAVALAVLEAPRNMFAWNEAEKAAICPWAAALLKEDPRPAIATRAAGLLGSCTGEFVDLLLERGEKSLKAGAFKAAEISAFRDLCSSASLRQTAAASEAQCERNRKLLTGVVNTKKLESQTRSLALVSLAYQWPDDKTLTLARSLQKNADKELAERARATVKRIEERKAMQKPARPQQE